MAPRPIFAATHPRACSTAFERVFMNRRDTLASVHEPFGDAYYYGPERLGDRYKDDAAGREASGFADKTYKDILDQVSSAGKDGKRIFIKDMAYYLFSPDGKPTKVASSLSSSEEPGNPTTLPLDVLRKFHFTFLIRHPRRSIPSFFRCTVPPQNSVTGWDTFMPQEAGYEELVRLFDFLIEQDIVDKRHITVIDADDMLDKPAEVIRAYCERTGIDFTPDMLVWSEDDERHAKEQFEKWNGWHDDAIKSSSLRARTHAQKQATVESENEEWEKKFGREGQEVIRATVDANIPHYEYLKQYCIRF